MFKRLLVLFLVVLSFGNLLVAKVYAEELENEVIFEIQDDLQEVENEEIIELIEKEEGSEEIINNNQIDDIEIDTEINKENDEDKDLIDEENNTEEVTDDIEEIKTKEDIFTSYSVNMTFEKGVVTIKGNINKNISVKEILGNIDVEGLQTEYLVEKIGIINEDDIWLKDEDYVTNLCYMVLVSNEFVSHYQISFLGDLNQDNLVNEEDIETGIDNFFKEIVMDESSTNNEIQEKEAIDNEAITGTNDETIIEAPAINETSKKEIITIPEEVSYIDAVIDNNSYEVETPIEEESLNVSLENNDKLDKFVDEEVIVELKIDGFIDNYINTISGYLKYDKEILKLENIYVLVDGKVLGTSKDNKFIYVLDNYNKNDTLLVLMFKGLNCGTTKVSIEQLNLIMNGTNLNFIYDNNFNITISEYGKGGDVEPPINVDTPDFEQKPIIKDDTYITDNKPSKLSPTINNNHAVKEEIVLLSNDSYIKNIEIVGHELLFDKDVSNYSIKVDYNVNNLDLNVILNNDKSTFFITGNEQFKVGKNEVILTVFAEDGSSRDYVIEVNKKKDLSELKVNNKDNDNKNWIEFIVLVGLIVGVILLIYRLLKKDN